jgi:hypothetical protein
MLYKALGFLVWKTVKFYVVQKAPVRGGLALGAAVLVLLLGVGGKRVLGSGSSPS